MRKSFSAVLGTALVVGATQIASATSAFAEAPSCVANNIVCLYEHTNWGGAFKAFNDFYAVPQNVNLVDQHFNDVMSSWSNYGGRYEQWTFDLDSHGNPSGEAHCMPPHVKVSAVLPHENDRASGLQLLGPSGKC